MDTDKNESNILNDDKLRMLKYHEHYKHMCEAGFDPLICINRKFRVITYSGNRGGHDAHDAVANISERDMTQFIDRVITEERYADILQQAKTPIAKLDEIITIPSGFFCNHIDSMIGAQAAIFWLYPSGCRTLGDLYKKYEKKIKHELRSHIIT